MDDRAARELVDAWVAGYRRAWVSNEPTDIEAIFTPDARYFPSPSSEPWRDHAGIVAGWRDRQDVNGDWRFRYEIRGIDPSSGPEDGLRAFVRGWTDYPNAEPRVNYDNLWVVDLTPDGRAHRFIDWWMERKATTA